MIRNTMIAVASVMMMTAPALAQELQGAAGSDATSVKQYHRAINHQGGHRKMTMGRSASTHMQMHKNTMRTTPANSGTYGGTQVPGHGGQQSEQ